MKNKGFKEETLPSSRDAKGFKLPLSTVVEGTDTSGKPFKEKTVLSFISYQGSSFWLKTPIAVGTKLRITSELPQSLSEDKSLKLIVKGEVIFIESSGAKNTKFRVSLRFDSKYIIKED